MPRSILAAEAAPPARPVRRAPEDGIQAPGHAAGAEGGALRGADFVVALERGLAVLQAFGLGRERLTLSAVAAATGLSRGTARRFLLTLAELGFLATDGKLFWPTPRVLNLSSAYLNAYGRGELASRVIGRVVGALGESCSMAVLDGPDILYVARHEMRRVFSARIEVGTRLPAHCSAMGRVLLAGLDDARIEEWLAQYPRTAWTERTVTDHAALRERILEARRQGYALIDGEIQLGHRSIAVPVADRQGRTVAALNIGTASGRATLDRMRRAFLPVLRDAAREIAALVPHW
ncbi:helix-turn-helix domain-containing protein [Roseomonas sp. NAR14]|uniref:Helix-turn-helix domain-containing protein n=1 Tax=Roseomonas acroporae TaxID=2937791 RepID=A0A9X2BSK5_9PROT|nr:IclR family transcriptional regulator C-terminal domain-containing protein [Roseomonas acroporae]MCK8783207.1 helix-turn-helix domain-containing protein [Roseomonas acroporae]